MSDKEKVEALPELHDSGRYSKQDGSGGGEPGGYVDVEAETDRRADGANQASADASGYPDAAIAEQDAPEVLSEDEGAEPEGYDAHTLVELQDIARERGITYAGVRKAELVSALDAYDSESA